MAFSLGKIKKISANSLAHDDYCMIDPQITKRNHCRRYKGKLYKISMCKAIRDWIADSDLEDTLQEYGTIGLRQNSKSDGWTQSRPIPEGEIVLYLQTISKGRAKVLWGERIFTVPRHDLEATPISS